jgi:hypothetical protein
MDNQLKNDMDALGKEMIKELVAQLIQANKVASGDLIKNLDYKVLEEMDNLIIQLIDNSKDQHLKYVDQGRKPGRMPPIKPIVKWITDRKIKLLPTEKPEGIAFAIAKKIGRDGIVKTDVIKKTIGNILNNKKKLIETIGKDQVNLMVQKMLKELK